MTIFGVNLFQLHNIHDGTIQRLTGSDEDISADIFTFAKIVNMGRADVGDLLQIITFHIFVDQNFP